MLSTHFIYGYMALNIMVKDHTDSEKEKKPAAIWAASWNENSSVGPPLRIKECSHLAQTRKDILGRRDEESFRCHPTLVLSFHILFYNFILNFNSYN